jgi:upstream-binding transcription factor
MTNNTQMTNINELFMQFLNEHGSEDMVQEWQKPKYQEKLMELLPKKTKMSGKKDPNKPKRGKSAYLFFCADHRASVKEELDDEAKATEVTAELGKQWNELKESTKAADKKKIAKYEAQAKQDKERYLAEMEGYEPPSDDELEEAAAAKKRKSSGNKDPNKPKRGKSAYIFFCADHRATVKEDLGDANAKEVTVELGRLWNELKESKKTTDKKKLAKYEEQAKQDKERYLKELEEYEPDQVTADELSPPTKKNKTTEKKAHKLHDFINTAKLVKGATVRYKPTGGLASILAVHPEDQPAYYTIDLGGGQERQTTAERLEVAVAKPAPKTKTTEKKATEKKATEKKTTEKKTTEKKTTEKKLSGYHVFCKKHREQVKEENPELKGVEVTKILAGMWKALPEDKQSEWKVMAADN